MTSSGFSETVDAALQRLGDGLSSHLQVVDLTRDEPRVQDAVSWLLNVRHGEGYWGHRSPAITATCCLAIAEWRPPDAEHVLGLSAEWLLEQADDGRWETLWDSAVALHAVLAAGRSDDPRTRSALEHLRRSEPRLATGRPHHAAQVLALAQSARWPSQLHRRWTAQVRRELPTRRDPYVAGQAVHALLATGTTPDDLSVELDALAEYLRSTPLSTAAFLDHAAALRALAASGGHEAVVDETIDEMFGSAWRRDGSWYHDPWYTAWALLALHEVRAVRRVVVEQPRFNAYMADAAAMVEVLRDDEQRATRREHRDRLRIVGWILALEAGVVGLGYAAFVLPDSSRLFSSGLGVTSVLAVLTAGLRGLWPLLRPPERWTEEGHRAGR
jgi:hypothetical protein